MKKTFPKLNLFLFIFAVAACLIAGTGLGHAQAPPALACQPPGLNGAGLSGTSTPNPYGGIDLNIEVIFSHPQLLALPSLNITPDNYLVAPNLNSVCPGAGYKDQVLTYAAILFCQQNVPNIPNPYYNILPGKVATLAQMKAMADYDEYMKVAMPLYAECIHEVDRRTAYPQGSTAAAANGQSMYTIQDQACYLLKGKLDQMQLGSDNAGANGNSMSTAGNGANHGMGIAFTGKAQADGALAECDTYGLSEEVQQWLRHHRCDDIQTLGANSGDYPDSSDFTRSQTDCAKEATAYDAEVTQRKSDLKRSLAEFYVFRKEHGY